MFEMLEIVGVIQFGRLCTSLVSTYYTIDLASAKLLHRFAPLIGAFAQSLPTAGPAMTMPEPGRAQENGTWALH